MELPSSVGSILASGGLFSDIDGVRRRQISRVNAYAKGKRSNAKENRKLRKAEYKAKMMHSGIRAETRDAIKANPLQHGLPRRFKVLVAGHDTVADAKVHDDARYLDENHFIHFAAFGIPGKAVQFNNTWIHPDGSEVSPDKRIYTLSFPEHDGTKIHIYLDFTIIDQPTGYLANSKGQYALKLQPYAISFDVSVAKNAGAYKSTAKNTFQWDETSTTWKNATWDSNTMVFSYDTVVVNDGFGNQTVNEVSYQDSDDPNSVFELDASQYSTYYTAVMNGTVADGVAYLDVLVTGAPVPPVSAVRTQDKDGVLSVFPDHSFWKFDELGMNFTGAYTVANSNQVYGVIGTGQSPFTTAPGPKLPPVQLASNGEKKPPVFHSSVKPTPHFDSLATSGPTPMPVTGLMNFDPMKPDPNSVTGFTDTISVQANADFHNIILYWMDPSIHNLFISSSPTTLDASVLAIATDSNVNKTFYQTLQVPYITSSLGNTPNFDLGKQCNGTRASALLKDLPTNGPYSDVYSRHSDALYKLRYKQQFAGVQAYLDDQAGKTGNDYTSNIAAGSTYMQTHITQVSNGVNGPNSSDLQVALQDIKDLAAWATSQKLFYAFSLYAWAGTYFLPNLYAQSANGTLSSSVSRSIKKISTVMGILEGSQQNPNGKSFQEAFNDLIRVYQMTALIPQFVDADGNVSDFDSIVQAMLEQFYAENSGSSDPNMVKQAQLALQLANDQAALKGFMTNLVISMRVTGSLGSWVAVVNNFQLLNIQSKFYNGLLNAADVATTFMRAGCVALLVLPMLTSLDGGWKTMKTDQQIVWTTTAAALFLTFTIKALQGILRLNYFWSDLGGFGVNAIKAFFGFSKVLADLPEAAVATTNTFARWLIRTGPETMELTGDEITIAMKIFGRSAGEFLANCVGAVLAGVNIVMSIIDAVKSNDPLEKAMDSMMIISSGFQLLAIGASWLVSAEIVTAETAVAVLETVGACLGPLVVLFAVAGLIIMIVMMFRKGPPPDNPVQDFINNQVAAANLKKIHNTCIDDFNVVPADSAAGSLNGISFQLVGAPSTQVLQLGSSNSATPPVYSVGLTGAITYLPDTCWCVKTDSSGNTMIFTYALDANDQTTSLCLGEQTDGSIAVVPLPQKVTKDQNGNPVLTDPTVYAQQMSMLQWNFTAQSDATQVQRTFGKDTIAYTTEAQFSITRTGTNPKNLYAVPQSNGSYQLQLSTTAPTGSDISNWTLALQTMGPSAFEYVQSAWTLDLTDTDEQDFVNFLGTTSLPLSWSITPTLPSFLQFSDPAANPGGIIQVSGTTPTVMAAQTYQVTASISIEGRTFSQTASLSITVIDGSKAPPSPTLGAHKGTSSALPPLDGVYHRKVGSTTHNDSEYGKGPVEKNAGKQSQKQSVFDVTDAIRQAYNKMMSAAPSFFKWMQPDTTNMNQHYTASTAIARMQNSVSGTWKPYLFISHDFEDIYFPSRSALPPAGANDPQNYNAGANGFVAMAIYNGDGHAQGISDLNGIQNTINNFNNTLWNTNVDRYVDWLQWSGSTATTGGPCSYNDYYSCITDPDWIAMKAAEQNTPSGWSNQSFEMFHHFLKLTSLGATPDQISGIYTTITASTTGPKLDPSGFGDITPTTWRNYRGYIFNTGISYTQLQVQNLNETYLASYPTGDGGVALITEYADSSFIQQAGYFKAPPSGCCFEGSTAVILEDGSEVEIGKVQPGQSVRSSLSEGSKANVVQWISRPMLKGRPLFSYKNLPGVLFTSTHPIYLGQEGKSPVLGFVDVQTALKVNPLWGAFDLKQLAKDELVQHQADTTDIELFDLVLEAPPQDSKSVTMSTFVVKAASGETLTVCSEAPDMSMLPAATRFMLSFANTIGRRPDTASFFPEGLSMGVLDYASRVRKHRTVCASAAIHDETNNKLQSDTSDSITMGDVLSIFNQAKVEAQILADSIEAITASLGLSLPANLEDGWQYLPTDFEGSNPVDIISTHFLQLAHPSVLDIPQSLAMVHADSITRFAHDLSSGPTLSISITAGLESKTKETDNCALSKVSLQPLGLNLHSYRSDIKVTNLQPEAPSADSKGSTAPRYTVHLTVGSLEFIATGTVSPGVEAKWPVYHSPHNNGTNVPDPSLCSFHVGWLSLTCGTVTEALLSQAQSWAASASAGTPMERYGELLGQAVGEDILKSIYGGS